jgi:hypothetical protein
MQKEKTSFHEGLMLAIVGGYLIYVFVKLLFL